MKQKADTRKSEIHFNLLDLFLVLLVVLAILSVYFTFISPIRFSNLIHREGVTRFAEVDILLADDLSWMQDVIPVGEEFHNVYGELDWKILGFENVTLGGRKMTKAKVKLLIVQESSGILRYGKYTLVQGSKIYLINDRFFLEGRIFNFKLLEEKILL